MLISPQELVGLRNVLRENCEIIHTNTEFAQQGLLLHEHPIWGYLGKLYSRRWFHRLWTLQEALLARGCLVVYGDRVVIWKAFFDIGMRLLTSSILFVSSWEFERPQRERQTLLNHRTRLESFTKEATSFPCTYWKDGPKRSLNFTIESALSSASLLKSSDPKSQSTTPYPHLQLFVKVSKAVMEYSYLFLILYQANSDDRPRQLPSWCPDFDAMPETIGVSASQAVSMRCKRYFREDPQSEETIHVGDLKMGTIEALVDNFSWHWPEANFATPHTTNVGRMAMYGTEGAVAKILRWMEDCATLVLRHTPQASSDRAERLLHAALLADVFVTPDRDFPLYPAVGFAALVAYLQQLTGASVAEPRVLCNEQGQFRHGVQAREGWGRDVFVLRRVPGVSGPGTGRRHVPARFGCV